jgi:ATP-binding cassette, subfamily B, multidrug efflux pump
MGQMQHRIVPGAQAIGQVKQLPVSLVTLDDSMRSLLRLVPYLRRHKWPLIGGMLALVLTNVFQVRVPRVVGVAMDTIKTQRPAMDVLAAFAVLIVALVLLQGVFRYLMRWWIVGASRDVEFEFRNDIFTKLTSLTPSFYDRQRTGDLMSKATNDVDAVRMILGPGILNLFNTVTIFPLVLFRMLSINAALTGLTMLPILLLPIVVNYYGNRVHRRFRKVQDHYSVISAMVQENLAGIRVVKAFTQEKAQIKQFAGLNEEFIHLNVRLALVQAAFFPMMRILGGLSVVILLWVGGYLVIHGTLTLGSLIEFSLLLVMLFWPMVALGWTVSLLQRGAASMERIDEVMKLEPAIAPLPANGARASVTEGAIEFRALNFRYAPDTPVVLHDINLKVPSGGRLGVVGPTGSGKSTLACLLAHLYTIDRGQLLIDGADVNDIPLADLRDKVSIVFQETFLFSDTISNNIAFGVAGIEMDEVGEVAAQAHIAPEIEQFPHRYDTMLGERGINLSGGQKQRVAIARALIRDPRIIVLDDALSAVDTETEERIIESLRDAMRGRTAVIIAHRVSAVMHCDQIIVLDDGRIVERGNHEELLGLGGLYASLFRKQLLSEAVELETG